MRRSLACLSLWLLSAIAALCAEPFVRVAIDDDGKIVPGQQVHVTVDVFVTDFFTSAPEFPLFDIPNAVVTLPDVRDQNLVETIDGIQYSGIQRSYVVVPQVPGTFTLPPVTMGLVYMQDGKAVTGNATLPPTSFKVAGVAGATSTSLAFAARDLTITQSFDRDPASLKTGEAVVRIITVFAGDTQAMMIPAIQAPAVDGLKAYVKPPRITDGVEAEDGSTGSTRVETITYVAEVAGTFEIPEISYNWFDIDARSNAVATLPAVAVKVSKAPMPSTGIAPEVQAEENDASSSQPDRWILLAAVLVVTVAGIGWLIRRSLPFMRRRMQARLVARSNSEQGVFRRLLASIDADHPKTVYRNLEAWTHSAGFGSIGAWLAASGDVDILREIETLERELFGPDRDGPRFDRSALSAALRTTRAKNHGAKGIVRASALPPLNPGGGPPVNGSDAIEQRRSSAA